jgi:hypothetical protein
VASRLRPQLADIHAIFRHAVPTWARTPSTLAVLGQRVELPPSYAEFLTFCDGWTGLDGQTDLFPISALLDGPAAEAAWVVVEAYDDGSGGQFGLSANVSPWTWTPGNARPGRCTTAQLPSRDTSRACSCSIR